MRKNILLICFAPLFLFSQETIVGDVDCNGELNSEDASLILQYVTSIIDSLPCNENMTGLTPDQLEEMINMINDEMVSNIEETITMISPMYHSDSFPDFPTWDSEEGAAIYYADAFRFCAQLIYDDYDDWRLPTVADMHNYIQTNPQEEFLIPDHNSGGWGTFWTSAYDNPSSSLMINVPIVNISGPTHATLPNQILYYGTMDTYSMINCFCVR